MKITMIKRIWSMTILRFFRIMSFILEVRGDEKDDK